MKMTYIEEAIETLRKLSYLHGDDGYDIFIAIDALRKEIPFKPIPYNNTLKKCKCEIGFVNKTMNCCGNCGQKLDWEE